MFSCYEQLVADAAGEESIESIAQTSATSKRCVCAEIFFHV